MPKKHQYSQKEHRQVSHIQESEEARGVPAEEAEAIGYATVIKRNPGKHRFTAKEDRRAEHIAKSEKSPRQIRSRGQTHRLRDCE